MPLPTVTRQPPPLPPTSAAPRKQDGPKRDYTELPTISLTIWERVQDVAGALSAMEVGNFRSAALMSDAMLRDDRINGVLTTRINALLGTPLEVKPPKDSAKGQGVADLLGGTEDTPGLWQTMFDPAAVGELMRWGLLLGIAVAELVWDTAGTVPGKQWVPRLKVYHPMNIIWRWDTRSYWLSTMEGLVELPNTDRDVHSDGHWLIYTPYGYSKGWFRGLLRSLAMPWYIRGWTYKDWASYSERHGKPIVQGIVPANADEQEKYDYFQALISLRNQSTIISPQNEEGLGYDVKLIEAVAKTHEAFNELLTKVETSIAVDILGQNLTTEGSKGLGSHADAGENVRQDYRRFDGVSLAQAFSDQVVYWWAIYNYGSEQWAPKVRYAVDPPDDLAQEAAALLQLFQAMVQSNQAGAPVDWRTVLDAWGLPLQTEEEIAAQQALQTPQVDPQQLLQEITGAMQGAADVPGAMKAVAHVFARLQQVQPGAPGRVPPPAADGGDQAPADDSAPSRSAQAAALAALEVQLAYGGGDYALPDDHLAAMRVPGGASCAKCTYLADDRAHCTSPDYLAWRPDGQLVDPLTQQAVPPEDFCSDWYAPSVATATLAGEVTRPGDPPHSRTVYQGLPVVVENKRGSIRTWVGDDGQLRQGRAMLHDYGYLDGYLGVDGEEVDVYVGPHADAAFAYVVRQRRAPEFTAHDEDKVMLGFRNAGDAEAAYLAQYDDPRYYGGMVAMPMDAFKAKLQARSRTPGKIAGLSAARAAAAAGDVPADRVRRRLTGTRSDATPAELLQAALGNVAPGVRPAYGARRAKLYAPTLERKATARARAALRPDLARVLAEVHQATDAHDLRRRLQSAFRSMDPRGLAKVIARARLMAQLAGRHDVLADF